MTEIDYSFGQGLRILKLCLMCDLHLPSETDALQYDVLAWAVADIRRKKPDCVIYAGDITCDGTAEVLHSFLQTMNSLDMPFLFIPGNSDLRCEETKDELSKISSPIENDINGVKIFAVNDCDATVTDEQLLALEGADDESIVFMHHPVNALRMESRKKFLAWRDAHKETRVFYAHRHLTETDGESVCLQAMDPDKAIGECPCISYYDTDSKELRKEYYFSPVPYDFYDYFGISCYRTTEHISFAVQKGLKMLELRPNCIGSDPSELADAIAKWRAGGGEDLCIHLPEVNFNDGDIYSNNIDKYIELANLLHADRFTQHVPKVSVATVKADATVLPRICAYLAEKFNAVDHEIVIGVENMHMTPNDKPDDTRRFGYLPEECIEFMQALDERCNHRVGINLDIGHARNNAPYSQTYQTGTWLALLGKYAVGYHVHQVTSQKGVFENHMPITDIYGKLISYASFFRYWATGVINKAPLIFEMRPEDGYEITLQTFAKEKARKVFDIHSHTDYSRCGRDNPRILVENAIKNGISLFGMSGHGHGIGPRKSEYVETMRALADEYKDKIKIVCGIEIATVPPYFDTRYLQEIKDFDYCLIEHITYPESVVGGDLFAFCKKLGILCGIAHTDLFEYCDIYGYDYREFFAKMAENNIFWEMNVAYDSIHKYVEHQYVKDLMTDPKKLEIVRNSGIAISLGSDCRRAEEYTGYYLYRMYDFLKANGVKTADALLEK